MRVFLATSHYVPFSRQVPQWITSKFSSILLIRYCTVYSVSLYDEKAVLHASEYPLHILYYHLLCKHTDFENVFVLVYFGRNRVAPPPPVSHLRSQSHVVALTNVTAFFELHSNGVRGKWLRSLAEIGNKGDF